MDKNKILYITLISLFITTLAIKVIYNISFVIFIVPWIAISMLVFLIGKTK